MEKLRQNDQINNNLPHQNFMILKNCCDDELHINESEFILLKESILHHNCEIIEPANNDSKSIQTIVSLYNKKLIRIDFKKDKLFVSDLGKKILE